MPFEVLQHQVVIFSFFSAFCRSRAGCAGQQVVHLIVSRTATGSSCRFVAAFAVAFLQLTQSSMRHRAASGLLSELTENLSFSTTWGSRGSMPAGSLPSSPLGSPRRWWGGFSSRRNVSSFGSLDSSAGQEDDGSLVERYATCCVCPCNSLLDNRDMCVAHATLCWTTGTELC